LFADKNNEKRQGYSEGWNSGSDSGTRSKAKKNKDGLTGTTSKRPELFKGRKLED
jgi:hypothetical protein